MSKTVDERVVSMQFDNAQFERNVSTTMSTLDKLKQKLHLDGAAKGFDEVSTAAKKVDLSGISTSAETVGLRFNAMYTIADQALRNITNSAMMYGQKIVSALTIDPVKTGFQEYETQINAIQTILANTESKGTTLDDVNKALDELNAYADKTIYNFTEMTKNIGTFTAAGVDLDTSVSAIQGIANLAAVSGSTSQQASTAMYQLSQALSSGTVKLMDWNSVVNAGMGGEVFQNALKETARVHGVAIDDMIEKEGSFRETLSNGWLTSEILTDTLKKFTMAAEEGSEQWEEYKKSLMDSGYTEEQAKAILKMANTATDAATKVKTFTQLWDVLKEAAQSGWTQTWEIIIGDFEEAKGLLTPVSDFFTGIINKTSEWRNALLESALGKGFSGLKNSLSTLFDVGDAISTITDALVDYNTLANDIIRGDWGNGQARWDALAKAGYDWAHAQNLVNEQLGSTVRYETNYSEATNGAAKATDGATTATTELTEANIELLESLIAMSDEQLREKGYTEDQIKALRELESTADKLGLSLHDFLTNLDDINGRWLLLNSFKNVGKSLVAIGTAIGNAWKNIFPSTLEQKAEKIFNVIAAIHRTTAKMVIDVDNLEAGSTMDKLIRSFEGLFAIIDIVTTITGGAFKIAFKVVSGILGYFNMDILDLTAVIGDALVKFRDWIDSVLDISSVLDKFMPHIAGAAKAVSTWVKENINLAEAFNTVKGAIVDVYNRFRDWIDSLKKAENLPEAIAEGIASGFGKAVDYIKSMFTNLGETISNGFSDSSENPIRTFAEKLWSGIKIVGQVFVELGKIILEKFNGVLTKHGFNEISFDMISGLVNGIKDGAIRVGQAMLDLGKMLIAKIKEILGIHSPSTVFFAIGGFIIAGLIAGLLSGGSTLGETLQNMVTNIVGVFQNIDWGTLFTAGMSVGLLVVAGKLTNAISKIASAFEGLGDMFEGLGDMFKDVGIGIKNWGKSLKTNANANLIKSVAIAIGVLVAAVVILTKVDQVAMWKAIGAIGALSAIFVAMTIALDKLPSGGTINTAKLAGLMLSVGVAMLIFSSVVKKLGKMEWDELAKAAAGMTLFGALIVGLIAATNLLASSKSISKDGAINKRQMEKLGSTLLAVAGVMLIMTIVAKIIAGMEWAEMGKAAVGITFLGAIITGLIAATKLAGKDIGSAGATLLKIGAALLLLAVVAKIIAGMEWDEMAKAAVGITFLGGIIVGLIAATKLIDKMSMFEKSKIDNIGATLMAMAGAMLIMTFVAKIISGMTWGEMGKAAVGIVALGGVVAGLVAVTKLASDKELKGVAKTLLAMSVAIGILALVAVLLGMVKLEILAKGITAVGLLGAVVSLMVYATKDVQDCKANLIVLTVAILAMAAAIAALSFIDGSKLAAATLALSAVMAMFAVLIKESGMAQKSMGALIVITVAVGVIGGILYLLGTLPVESAVGAAVALSTLLLAVAAVLAILGKINTTIGDAISGAISLTLMAIPLIAFVGVLAAMQNVQNVTRNVNALVVLTGALTLLLIPLTIVGNFALSAIAGIAALLLLAVPLVAFVGVLALMQNIQNATANVHLLVTFVGTLTAMLVVLAIVGPLAMAGVTALAALTGLISAIGLLAVGVGALMEKFPEIERFLDTGIPILEKLAFAIGSIAGNVIAGFSDAIMAQLPVIGMYLSEFMTNITPFIEGCRTIDESVLAGVGVLSAAIIALTVADLIAGVGSFLTLGSSFAKLGTDLSDFMTNAMPFIESASLIDESMLSGVRALADTVLILTAANVLEGLTSWFTGGSSLATFGAQLPQLGSNISAFATNLGTFDEATVTTIDCAGRALKTLASAASEIPNEGGLWAKLVGENSLATFGSYLSGLGTNLREFVNNLGTFDATTVTTVDCAGQALKALASAASEIPNEGGLWAKIFGENSLATFGGYLPALGTNLRGFVENLGTFGDDTVTTVDCAGRAIKALATAATEIPNEGGLWAKIFGENSLATFGSYLGSLGTNLKSFVTNIGTFGEDQIASVTCACTAITSLANAASSIPNEGGLWSRIFGDNSLATFGESIGSLGSNLKSFVKNLGEFGDDQIATVSSAVKAINAFAALGDIDLKDAAKYLDDFGDSIVTFASDIADFCSDLSGTAGDNVSLAITNMNRVISAIKNIDSSSSDIVENLSDSLKKFANEGIDAFVNAFTNNSTLTEVENAGKKLADKVIDGVEAKETDFKNACDDLADSGASKIKTLTNYNSFKAAGKYLVEGFAAGISNNTSLVTNAVNAMTSAAEQQARDSLLINSPSKIFIAIGGSVPEGFAKGVNKMGGYVTEAVSNMSRMAINGVGKSIARIAAMVDSDIDVQPTIRPVVDLSEVRTGVDAIGDMMNMGASVGVMANVNGINYAMNRRGQNGTNADVISAIDKLNKNLENAGGDTYSIGNISYAEGSDVAEALKTIVRAAKIERRS